MGASSSSAFWSDMNYDHSSKQLTSVYEKTSVLMPGARVVEFVNFTIGDAKKLLGQVNLYPDISLVLDIDFTLGEASIFEYDLNKGIMTLDNKKVDIQEIHRLIESGKAAWFHNKTCVFFLRPYFKEFIQFCDKNFKEVIIWTNGVQRHADNMVELVESIIGKKWKGYGRNFSTSDRKIVTTIGLDPLKTWMVDDDHRHHYVDNLRDETKEVNPDIKFFHGPEFSMTWFKDFHEERIPKWNKEMECYDDWFLFLIWNWNYMKEKGKEMKKYIRNENRFICE
jgi:hypothetical protein